MPAPPCPVSPTGSQFDRRLFVNRGDVFEGEYRYAVRKHAGTVRLLNYENHADAGNYAAAIRQAQLTGGTPDVTATRRNGTLKYGFGINIEQEFTKDVGVFAGLAGTTAKPRALPLPPSIAWPPAEFPSTDGAGTGRSIPLPPSSPPAEFPESTLYTWHEEAYDFLIGDGRLKYGPEYIEESYYSARLFPGFFASFDLQHVANPAYNQQRGPLWISSIRLHIELGKDTFGSH